ncbi:MAG: DksA/TraR family C4-type zinc finger protein [Moraxella sp.]
MASGWAADGAENEQMPEATINDAIERAKRALPQGESLTHCEECDALSPKHGVLRCSGVRLCVRCQQSLEQHQQKVELFNRRGSK